jgi:hypothetical protein
MRGFRCVFQPVLSAYSIRAVFHFFCFSLPRREAFAPPRLSPPQSRSGGHISLLHSLSFVRDCERDALMNAMVRKTVCTLRASEHRFRFSACFLFRVFVFAWCSRGASRAGPSASLFVSQSKSRAFPCHEKKIRFSAFEDLPRQRTKRNGGKRPPCFSLRQKEGEWGIRTVGGRLAG